MPHQQKKEHYFLSPSDSAMTDSTEFYHLRKQQPKKQFSLLSKSRRGMRPMRSSSSSTIVSLTQQQKNNKARSRYNSINSTSSSITLCSQHNFIPTTIMNSSVFELGPKKGNIVTYHLKSTE